jgi:hypothetical protein
LPVTFLASIPSPHSGTVDVGPFSIHLYGVMLLLAIAACVALTGYRWVKWGGDWDLVFRVAVWGVAFGIVGARLYHDITSWSEVKAIDAWWAPFAVWKGGLGVWGGILFGVLAGAWIVRRSGNSVRLFMDAVAPGLLLAQGIGRWGNWFNQELYGKPTSLPWGLKIDEAHRALRALRLLVLLRPLLRGAAADRSRARVPRAAAERLRLDRRLRPFHRVLHLVAVHPQGDPGRPAAGEAGRPGGPGHGRAEGPRPLRPLAFGADDRA